jgi:hypothetical protein
MPEAQELDKKIEEIKQELQRGSDVVSSWSSGKREDVEAIMYAPSLSSYYESVLKPR